MKFVMDASEVSNPIDKFQGFMLDSAGRYGRENLHKSDELDVAFY